MWWRRFSKLSTINCFVFLSFIKFILKNYIKYSSVTKRLLFPQFDATFLRISAAGVDLHCESNWYPGFVTFMFCFFYAECYRWLFFFLNQNFNIWLFLIPFSFIFNFLCCTAVDLHCESNWYPGFVTFMFLAANCSTKNHFGQMSACLSFCGH